MKTSARSALVSRRAASGWAIHRNRNRNVSMLAA